MSHGSAVSSWRRSGPLAGDLVYGSAYWSRQGVSGYFVRIGTTSLPELEPRHEIASIIGYADCLSLSLGSAACTSSQTCKNCAAVARKGQRVGFEVAAFARCASVAQRRLCALVHGAPSLA